MVRTAWLVPFLPLLGGLIAAVGGRRLKGLSHYPVVAGIGLAFLVSLGLLMGVGDGSGRLLVYSGMDVGDLHVPVEFRVDGLTTMMLAMVTFVSTLVAVYASGYMAGDPGYPRFFALIGLFVFSMTGLVLSNNYALTYAFWEGVGVCSYLLVGFWHAKPEAAAAAKKAFLVNRIGDFGFAIAIFWMWSALGGNLSYDHILNAETLNSVPRETLVGIAALLFWAATAKSAQIPLYVWLPDAMEGPTPVSALIHAATMVTAGVYLIARSSLLIARAPEAQVVICAVGCATALLAALIALTQTDLKRVMAYSTVSQLGYMFMGLGAGVGNVAQLAVTAAMFHLFTHAFFKALLFLASGSVMHAMGGVIDMRRFGGLRHRLPYTCWTFAAGGLALAGIPPLAGFWSKDEILAALSLASHAGAGWQSVFHSIYWVAVITAGLTAFYTGRAFFLTFFGPEKLPSPDDPEAVASAASAHAQGPALGHGLGHDTPEAKKYDALIGTAASHQVEAGHAPEAPAGESKAASDEPVPAAHDQGHEHGHGHDDHFGHESPPVMWIPLAVLAVCAVLVGMLFGWTGWFERHVIGHTRMLEELATETHKTDWTIPVVGTLAAILGLGLSWVMYGTRSPIPSRLASSIRPLYRASLNKFYIDEIYEITVVGATRAAAYLSGVFDKYVVDGLVQLTARLPRLLGREVLLPYQNGLLQFYAGATALGLAGLLLLLLLVF